MLTYERRGRESPFFSTKETRDGDVATRTNLTVGLDDDAATEIVDDKRLVGLGQSKLPG